MYKHSHRITNKHQDPFQCNTKPVQVTDLVACSARTSSPVDVILVVVGTVVVDHQDQLLDVQSSGRHRGGNHKATRSILKVIDDAVSVVLVNSYDDEGKGT